MSAKEITNEKGNIGVIPGVGQNLGNVTESTEVETISRNVHGEKNPGGPGATRGMSTKNDHHPQPIPYP